MPARLKLKSGGTVYLPAAVRDRTKPAGGSDSGKYIVAFLDGRGKIVAELPQDDIVGYIFVADQASSDGS